jgi:hypothetical protein
VIRLRRFIGLLVTVALAQLSLHGPAARCPSHDESSDPAQNTAMAAMEMASEQTTAWQGTGCEECTPLPNQAPCDHTGATGFCASMGACVGNVAVVESSALSTLMHDPGVLANAGLAPELLTSPPESPPPRA